VNPEDVIINFQVQQAQAMAAVRALEGEIAKLQGVTDKVHTATNRAGKGMATQYKTLYGSMKDNVAGAQALIGKIASLSLAMKIFGTAVGGASAMVTEFNHLELAAGLAKGTIDDLSLGIRQAAVETGHSFGEVAKFASKIVGQTGLTTGLGDIVKSAYEFEKVFRSSADTFADFAAQSRQLSNGILTGTELMKSFDRVTGLAGKQMDQVLGSLMSLGREMARITGGGQRFADAFKQISRFSAGASAEILKLGGDPESFQRIQESILDPRRWGEITKMMPGMAANLVRMQKALSTGDMETFGMLLKDGAQRTKAMGQGMNDMARAAAGFDFRAAEVLSKVDFAKAARGGDSLLTVTQRSLMVFQSLGAAISRLFNSVADTIMPILLPAMEGVLWTLTKITELMASNAIVRWTVSLGIAGAAVWGLVRVLGFMSKGLAGIGKAVGEGVGATFEGAANGIARGSNVLARSSGGLLAAGASFLMVGAGFYLLADGIVKLAQAPWSAIAKGAVVLVGALGALVGAGTLAMFAIPGLMALSATMLALGAGVALVGVGVRLAAPVMGQLGDGLASLATGISAVASSSWIQGGIALTSLAVALGVFAASAAVGALTIPTLADGLQTLAGSVNGVAGMNVNGIKQVVRGIVDTFGGLNVTSNVSVNSGFFGSVKALIDSMVLLEQNVAQLLSMGNLMRSQGTLLQGLFGDLFGGPDAIFIKAITSVDENLQGFFGNTTIEDNVAKSLTGVIDLITSFGKVFDDLAVMGIMLGSKVSSGATIYQTMASGIQRLLGPSGILTLMVDSLSKNIGAVATPGLDTLTRVVNGVAGLDTRGFLRSVNDLTGSQLASGNLSLDVNRSVQLATRSAADVAFSGYSAAEQAAHASRMETLLADIRDAVRAKATEAPRAAIDRDRVQWQPEQVFADFGGGNW
jgi:hypothetical protein